MSFAEGSTTVTRRGLACQVSSPRIDPTLSGQSFLASSNLDLPTWRFTCQPEALLIPTLSAASLRWSVTSRSMTDARHAAGDDDRAMQSRPVANSRLHGGRIYQETQAHDSSFVMQGDIYNSYDIRAPSKETWQGLSDFQKIQKQHERRELLINSLRFPRMSSRLQNVESPLSKTCQWFFSHEKFAQWTDNQIVSEHHGFLWIKGKPGSGKSTIMKHLHDHTIKRLWSDQIVISYFFNARAKNELEKSTLGLYRSLVHQLLHKFPACGDAFFWRFQEKEYGGSVEEWTAIELKAFLYDVLNSNEHPQVNILIDALDEGNEDDVRQMIEYLGRLAVTTSASSVRLRICLSSRHYPHISIRKGIEIVLEKQDGHTNDIRTYLQDSLCDELLPLRQQMCVKSAGIFLWVVLVVRILNTEIDQGRDIQRTKELLDSLPVDLNTLFEEIMRKNTKNMKDCIILLQWVLFSMNALRLQDLYVAVHYSSTSRACDLSVLPEEHQMRRWLLHQSRGLVEVVDLTGPENHHLIRPQFAVVQFIHETVRSFLLGVEGITSLDPTLRANIKGLSHEILKDACHLYIKRNKPAYDRETRLRRDFTERPLANSPFMDYAWRFLLHHANAAEKWSVSQREFLEGLKNSRELETWRPTRDKLGIGYRTYLGSYTASLRTPDEDLPLLHILVDQELLYLVQCLVGMGVDVNAASRYYGSALRRACADGNIKITRILLEQGADVNVMEDSSSNSFDSISRRDFGPSDAEVLTLLLQRGAYVSPSTVVRLMVRAIKNNYFPLLQLLLEKGGDPNAKDHFEEEPMLYIAGRHNNLEAVQLLLERGADVNARRSRYGTSVVLQDAVLSGHEDLVRIFLKAGADVTYRNGEYGSALQAAVVACDAFQVNWLLGVGADINQQGGKHGSALHAAVVASDEKMVKTLLQAGADVNLQGGRYGSALQAATALGNERKVKILLRAGADVNQQGGRYGSALKAAVHHFEYSIEKILLDHGATPTAT